jgi:mannosylglycerate hydrolase
MPKKYIIHVISGTHWDREWRHTAEQSKPRLVELIDSMIEILENNENYKVFCLDGGMVVLEDYLTIRPEKKEKLKKLAKSGRISLANWYTLPEMFTVAAEALIRNLKLGQQMAKEYGGAMKSGYTPTSYGQISQLPQIYKEFGIDNAIFYRGTTKYLYKPLFLWEGLDGSKLHVLRTFDEVTRTNWFFYVHQPLVLGKKPVDLTYYYNQNDYLFICVTHIIMKEALNF